MNIKYSLLLYISFLFISCSKNKTTEKHYPSDMNVQAYKLSCDSIVMSNYTGTINKSEFVYGEDITLDYVNMTGFALKDKLIYPEIDIFVTNKKGDTIISNLHLFEEHPEGFTKEDLHLNNNFIFAKPMLPNNEYKMKINISDKNSDATFQISKNFAVIHNPLIQTKNNGLTFDVQYIFSQTNQISVIDHKINLNEDIYLLIENLVGYDIDKQGKVDLHASVSLTDASGKIISKKDNMFPEVVNAKDLKEQLYVSMKITDKHIKNPITCVLKLKDNTSGNSMETTFNLTVEESK